MNQNKILLIMKIQYVILKWIRDVLFVILSIPVYLLNNRRLGAVPALRHGVSSHVTISDNDTDTERNIKLFSRLSAAYRLSKSHQKNVDQPYLVGGILGNILDDRFGGLTSALVDNNLTELKALLGNFNREQFSGGLGGDYEDYKKLKGPLKLHKYEYINTWYRFYKQYENIAGANPPLSFPIIGNPVGLEYNGEVISTSSIRYHYYATEIDRLLSDVSSPVICEIGGGLGGQVYKIISTFNRKLTYILFDIPEVLILSSFFLLESLPSKRILLYGEGPLNSNALDSYDLILMPNFALPQMGDQSADLFFNSCSLPEMKRETAEEYLSQIERVCGRYFMHVNHNVRFEWIYDGKKTVNMIASEINPDPSEFKKIYQHPRLFDTLTDKLLYRRHNAGHFAFLYERTNGLVKST